MIQGAINRQAKMDLAKHLTSTDENDVVEVLPARGVVAETIVDQLLELRARSAHGRTVHPLHHLHVDPSTDWTDMQYARHLELYEREFGLTNQPRIATVHRKHGRVHRHYVYMLVRRDGRTIPMRHDYARREKISRILEYEFGEPHVVGKHNRAVAAALKDEGRIDVASSMEAAGLLDAERPVAAISSAQRQQQKRTGVEKTRIQRIVLAAWQTTDDGASFERALEALGLSLAMGDKIPMVVDHTGNAHPLARMIGKASKATTGVRILAAEVRARLEMLVLRPLADIRLEMHLVPLIADLEQLTDPEEVTGHDKPGVMQSAADNADTLMVDEIAAILGAMERNDAHPLSAAPDIADVHAVAELLADIELISETIDPDDADIDDIATWMGDIDRLGLDELDEALINAPRAINQQQREIIDNATDGTPRHSAHNGTDSAMVEEVASILEVIDRDHFDLLPVATNSVTIAAVAELLGDIETIIEIVDADDAEIDNVATCLGDIDRLSVDELDEAAEIGLQPIDRRKRKNIDNTLGREFCHNPCTDSDDVMVEEIAAIFEAMARDHPGPLPVVSGLPDIDAVVELLADSETIDFDELDTAAAAIIEIAELVTAIDALTDTDIQGPPLTQGQAANNDVPAIGGVDGIDRLSTPAPEPGYQAKDKSNAKRIYTGQNADVPRTSGSEPASSGPRDSGRVQRDAPKDAAYRNTDRPDRGPPFGRPDHRQQRQGKNTDSASRPTRQKPSLDYQPHRGDSSAAGTAGPGNSRPRPTKPMITGARQNPTVVRPPPRQSLWRQAITKIGGGLNRLVSKAGLTSASTLASGIQGSAIRNVGKGYKQNTKSPGANAFAAEPTKLRQTVGKATSITRMPDQVAAQRRPVSTTTTLSEAKSILGDPSGTISGSPPLQIQTEAPKLPVDVMMNFAPTIMPTAPCQQQSNATEEQTNDNMPTPWN